jgi:transposase
MNKNFLTELERRSLIARHRVAKDSREADRIKAVLLADAGWTYRMIAEALFIDEVTASRHVTEYNESKKLTNDTNLGRPSKLTKAQTIELSEHLIPNTKNNLA